MVASNKRPRKVTSDSLSAYLAEVRRIRLLTPEEERELARRVQKGDRAALQELVERNQRFVVQVASKYQGYGLPLADLINEGNMGLIRAAQKFDPERGTRFITYAVWWIRQAILHALAQSGGAVRLPIRQAEALARLRQIMRELHQRTGQEPSLEELAEAMDMSPPDVEDLLRVYRPYLSLDAPIGEEDGTTRHELLSEPTSPSLEDIYARASMVQEIHDLLTQLEPREAQILRERFGFEGPPKSLAEIGRELGLSRERVRQLEQRARRKLQALAKEKALEHYLN